MIEITQTYIYNFYIPCYGSGLLIDYDQHWKIENKIWIWSGFSNEESEEFAEFSPVFTGSANLLNHTIVGIFIDWGKFW